MTLLNRKVNNIITFTPAGGTRVYLSPLINSDVITEEGTGMPPIDYITEQGPFQHGLSPKTFRLQPRMIQYRLRQQFCSSSAYASGRQALLDLLRPNRPEGAIGTLTKYLPNNKVLALDVAISEGPAFKARTLGKWDEWAIDEVIRFIAFNPVAYDPALKVYTFSRAGSGSFPYTFPIVFSVPDELSFPIEFPIEFYGYDITSTIAYLGNWEEYPTIVITGPAGPRVEIYNLTTGESLILQDIELGPSETATITLTYATKTIVRNDGTNLAHLAQGDLATFHLTPGDNIFRVVIQSPGASSSVVFQYHDRYIGY